MGYGGPRVAFHTLEEYLNYEEAIHHEDAARVRSILERRREAVERPARERAAAQRDATVALRAASLAEQAEVDARELRQARLRAERQERMKPKAGTVTMARLAALSQPKVAPEAGYGSHMFGKCMHQRSRVVEFPEGRSGQRYCPGIDRDRLVPDRPDTTGASLPPWMGSFSTRQRLAAATERRGGGGAAAGTLTSADIWAALNRSRSAQSQRGVHQGHPSSGSEQDGAPQDGAAGWHDDADDDDDVPSIFSSNSSTGPIEDIGAHHLCINPRVTGKDVARHLRMGGSRTTCASVSLGPQHRVEHMSLPELSHRVVALQKGFAL